MKHVPNVYLICRCVIRTDECVSGGHLSTRSGRGGAVTGVPGRDPSIAAFKGIPFAAPPVGDLRWRKPQPVIAWKGVRKSGEFASSCIQTIHNELKPWTYEFMTHNQISEDCLYLNVWTSARSAAEKWPVFVWVYSSASNSGSPAVPLNDGDGLAKKGLVVVTFNYPDRKAACG